MEIEKQIADNFDEAHKKSVVDAMVNHAAQSAIRAEALQVTLEASRPYTKEELMARPERVEAIDLIERLKRYRGHISELGEIVIEFRKSDIQHACDVNEARANITLAFRHLEDARMRLGKAIQAIDGGVSCYDK